MFDFDPIFVNGAGEHVGAFVFVALGLFVMMVAVTWPSEHQRRDTEAQRRKRIGDTMPASADAEEAAVEAMERVAAARRGHWTGRC